MKENDNQTDSEPEAKQVTLTDEIETDGTPSDIEMDDFSNTESENATQRIEQYVFLALLTN